MSVCSCRSSTNRTCAWALSHTHLLRHYICFFIPHLPTRSVVHHICLWLNLSHQSSFASHEWILLSSSHMERRFILPSFPSNISSLLSYSKVTRGRFLYVCHTFSLSISIHSLRSKSWAITRTLPCEHFLVCLCVCLCVFLCVCACS